MKTDQNKNQCQKMRKIHAGLWSMLKSRMLERLSDHVAECSRCQQRLAMVNRIELGLMFMKTQPLEDDLLSRANNRTLGVLKHSLRYTPKSDILRNAKSDTSKLEKMHPTFERLLNAAACLFVLVMIKTGTSNSLLGYREQGKAVMHNYYARNLDSRFADEIFPDDTANA
jgi:hypothetical protein